MLRFGTKTLEVILDRWVRGVIRYARAVVAASILVTAGLAFYTWTHFSINTDTDRMIDPELPFRQVYDRFGESFPQLANGFLIVIDGAITEDATDAANVMLAELQSRDELFLNVFAPGVGPYFDQNAFLFMDVEELSGLSDRLADAEPILAALAEDTSLRGLSDVLVLALDDAIENNNPPERLADVLDDMVPSATAAAVGQRQYLSWQEMLAANDADLGEMRRRVILVQPVLDFESMQPARAALAEARRLGKQVEANVPGATVRLTGKMALGAEELKSVSDGVALSGVISLILVALVLGLGIRSGRLVAAALVTLLMGLTWTAAFALAAIGYLNIISVAFAVLFIGLGVDFAIHFVLRVREEMWAGADIDNALRRTALGVGGPLALCAPTTALAFFAFVPTAYAGLAQLGIISGTGMFISLFTSLTILPALLKLMPPKMAQQADQPTNEGPGSYIQHHSRAFAVIGIAVGLAALIAAPQVKFEVDPVQLKDPETESVATFMDLLDNGKSSPYAVQIVARDVEEAATIRADLDQMAGVSRVITLASFVPEDQDEKLDILFDTSVFMTPVLMGGTTLPSPTTNENALALAALIGKLGELKGSDVNDPLIAAAQRLKAALEMLDGGAAITSFERGVIGLFPDALSRLRTGFGAGPQTLADLPANVTARYRAQDGRVRIEVFPEADLADQEALGRFVTEISARYPDATGNAVQVVGAGKVVIGAMKQATGTATIAIILFLLLVLGRVRDVALIAAPVILAASLTAAATVILDVPFNFANVIVLPLLIGLGVDSGIHLVLRARENLGETEQKSDVAGTSTPRAVLLSALTTIGSFGSLALSAHLGTASMGLLLTISVLLTLVAVLLVLPGLISWVYDHRDAGKVAGE